MAAGAPSLTPEHPFIGAILAAARAAYGERLRSMALFGSVARRTARPDSDVDLFLVVEDLPRGRRARLESFDPVEARLAGAIAELARRGIHTELSPVLRTPEDIRTASPLMLDLTEDAVILEDHGGVLAAALDDLRVRLRRSGAKRIWRGADWYWDLKPDYQRGEIIRFRRRDETVAFLVSRARMEAIVETMEILASPEAMRAIAEHRAGRTKFLPLSTLGD